MNLRELVEELAQYLPDGIDGEDKGPEVRLAIQPSWAFEHDIDGVAIDEGHQHDVVRDGDSPWFCDDQDCGKEWDHEPRADELISDEDGSGVVYIGEGGQLGYLPGSARDALGWER